MVSLESKFEIEKGIPKINQKQLNYIGRLLNWIIHRQWLNWDCIMKWGKGGEKNMKVALNLYIQAAEKGISQHLFHIYLCCSGRIGEKRYIDHSIEYLQKSAKNNNHKALVQYGILLLDRIFIPQNEEEAVSYFKLSSNLHDGAGKFWFVLCLIEEKGIKASYYHGFEMMRRWFFQDYFLTKLYLPTIESVRRSFK
jgi:TPR repeat protein